MNKRTTLALIALAIALTAVIWWQVTDKPLTETTRQTTGEESAHFPRTLPAAPPPPHRTTARLSADDVPATSPLPDSPQDQAVRTVRPGQVLAKVNGREIRLEDLIPSNLLAGKTEIDIPEHQLRELVARAIQRELILQEAAKWKVTLPAEKEAAIRAQWAEMEQRLKQSPPDDRGVAASVRSVVWGADTIEASINEWAVRALQDELMRVMGVASGEVNEDMIQAYYESHQDQYEALPAEGPARDAAWEEISLEIRNQLALEVRDQSRLEKEQYLNQLKNEAQIEVY